MGFNLFRNLFSKKETENELIIAIRHLKKYKDSIGLNHINFMLNEYKTADIIFKPFYKKITEQDLENMYSQIDKSDLSSVEKAETIVGLMMILDGSFPADRVILNFEKIFGEKGKELVGTIKQKQEEFKTDIALKKLATLIKGRRQKGNYSINK